MSNEVIRDAIMNANIYGIVLSRTFLILLIHSLLVADFDQIHAVDPDPLSCVFKETEVSAKCQPCERKEWLEMVKPSSGGDEVITNPEKTCFNNDPVTLYYGTDHTPDSGFSLVATGKYRTSHKDAGPYRYRERKEPFFRYAFIDSEPDPNSGNSAQQEAENEEYFDLDKVKQYYVKDGTDPKVEADVQLVEWPGAGATGIDDQLNNGTDCDFTSTLKECKQYKWMLRFEGDNGKILYYPCNADDGTNIAAVATIRNELNETKLNSSQKIWLAHGNQSFLENFVRPLYAPQYILEKMAKTESEDTMDCLKEASGKDLRTVMDFTFTRNRLLLGMKCGIILVDRLASPNLKFKVAILLSETGFGSVFPEPINKISSSTCCLSPILCGREGRIVAAYSFSEFRKVDDNKFIYVSFDSGNTFNKKIVASRHSPINVIKGLYKLYEQWHDYFEIIHNPDQSDLDDDEDDELLKSFRSKPVWRTSTIEEKEKLFSVGTASGKRNATLKKIVQILEHRVPKRKDRRTRKGINSDLTPDWVNIVLTETRKKYGWLDGWTDENCEKDYSNTCGKKFEDDKAVKWLLGEGGIAVKTPKRNENEPFCKEITSMLVIPEERHIMALCQVGYEKLDNNNPPAPPPSPSASSNKEQIGYFAIFNFPIKTNLPMIYGYRVSQRIFSCRHIYNDQSSKSTRMFTIQPEIVRIQGTATVFIINCYGVIYVSTNFGNTLFNTAFYYEHETLHGYCDGGERNPYYKNPPDVAKAECEEEGRKEECPHYLRTFDLCALNVPPVYATDASGYTLLVTFGQFYAYGAIAYNRETRLVVGKVLRRTDDTRRFETLLFPAVDRNGNAVLTVSLARAYSLPETKIRTALYLDKHSIRLVQMPLPYVVDGRYYDDYNLGMCQLARQKKFGFPRCKTSLYSIYPKRLDMDSGEKQYVQVEIMDENPFLQLWVFSSNENSVEVKVFHSLREGSPIPNLNVHNWKVEIAAKPNNKSVEGGGPFVDAFFGSDYNTVYDYSTQISFVNSPNDRCHIKPSSSINVQIGCKGKRLIAFEDNFRPQCKEFRKKITYTLSKGKYDPDMANAWIATANNQSRSFIKFDSDGNLVVTYDYVEWGCPLEPFKGDNFVPDLRVYEENPENETTTMKLFEGKFILIEIFGAKGFTYTKRVKDMNCKRAPQYLSDMIAQWKYRQRLFDIASERLKFPKTADELRTSIPANEIKGNKIMYNDAVKKHINIWNRANYKSCFEEDPTNARIPRYILDREYQVMTARDVNKTALGIKDEIATIDFDFEEESSDDDFNEITWAKDHPRVLVFLAVAVDDYNSLCDYQTLFGVSLKITHDMDDFLSFLVFMFFLAAWVLLVVGGYHVRKAYLRKTYMERAKAERLEQAAWSIIYRYEKLIHGNAMDALFHTVPDSAPASSKADIAAKSATDKRRAELRMKKSHILAQEQAKHERLQKVFQKL